MNKRHKRTIITKGFYKKRYSYRLVKYLKEKQQHNTVDEKEYFYFEFKDVPRRTRKSLIFDSKYYILCDVENLTPKSLQYIHRVQQKEIPLEVLCHLYHFQDEIISKNVEIKKSASFVVDKFTYWLNVKTIFYILACGDELKPVNNEFIGWGKLYLDHTEMNIEWINSYNKEEKLFCSNIKYIDQYFHI